METLPEVTEAPPLPESETEVIKKGRGRPRKEKIETNEPPKKRGRPKKEINITEIRAKMKPGPKTSLTADKDYYTKYYSTHYKGVCMTCPSCKNPNINVSKIHRHLKSYKCLVDTALNKYAVYGI